MQVIAPTGNPTGHSQCGVSLALCSLKQRWQPSNVLIAPYTQEPAHPDILATAPEW